MQGDPCMKCRIQGEKLYCLTEEFHQYEVCRECAMKYNSQHNIFVDHFMKVVNFPDEEIIYKPFNPDKDLPAYLYFDDKTGKYYDQPQDGK